MRCETLFLARYAEDAEGMLTAVGAFAETWNVFEPLQRPPDLPPSEPVPASVLQGTLVARLLVDPDETAARHQFRIALEDPDGGEVFRVDGELHPERDPELPARWPQPVVLVIPLPAVPLPAFGLYRWVLAADGDELAVGRLQVLKRYS
jgi:hypothetical protein